MHKDIYFKDFLLFMFRTSKIISKTYLYFCEAIHATQEDGRKVSQPVNNTGKLTKRNETKSHEPGS